MVHRGDTQFVKLTTSQPNPQSLALSVASILNKFPASNFAFVVYCEYLKLKSIDFSFNICYILWHYRPWKTKLWWWKLFIQILIWQNGLNIFYGTPNCPYYETYLPASGSWQIFIHLAVQKRLIFTDTYKNAKHNRWKYDSVNLLMDGI